MCNLSSGIEARDIARGIARGIAIGESRGKISSIKEMIKKGLITMTTIKESGLYTPEEIAAISAP